MKIDPIFTGKITVMQVPVTDDLRAGLSPAERNSEGKAIAVSFDCEINAAGMGEVFGSMLKALFQSLEHGKPPAEAHIIRTSAFAVAMESMGRTLDHVRLVQQGNVQ